MAPRARPARQTEPAKAVLPVVYERSGRWWVAELPAFPGAYSQGRTRAEAYRNLLSAMRDLIEVYSDEAGGRNPI
jgi:predicted RNase H-like HicB family nuclease